MTSTPDATSTSVTIALTKGTRISPAGAPSAGRTASRSWPWWSTSVTTPTAFPSAVRTQSPISSWSQNSSGSSGGASVPESTLSQVPRNSVAAVRSLMPSNLTMSSPDCQRTAFTVSGPTPARSVSSREPTANLSSGSSVRTPTTTSPRIPCGRPIRPTVTCMDRQRTSPVSSRSMRTCRFPARELITVRSARAVRPPLPMTFPRSSGCTRTSRTLPLRSILVATRTSSGCATIPLTRCSRASSSTSGSGTAAGGLGRRRRGLRRASRGLGLGLGRRRVLLRLVLLRRRPGRPGGGLRLLRREAFLHQRVVAFLLVRLRLAGLQGALATRLTRELLPVAGDGEQVAHRVGRLRAHREPVLDTVRVNLDDRRVGLRVVPADLLDGAPVSLGTRVGDNDPVVRFPDLAQAL